MESWIPKAWCFCAYRSEDVTGLRARRNPTWRDHEPSRLLSSWVDPNQIYESSKFLEGYIVDSNLLLWVLGKYQHMGNDIIVWFYISYTLGDKSGQKGLRTFWWHKPRGRFSSGRQSTWTWKLRSVQYLGDFGSFGFWRWGHEIFPIKKTMDAQPKQDGYQRMVASST